MKIYCVGTFDSFSADLLKQLDSITADKNHAEIVVGVLEDRIDEGNNPKQSSCWTREQRVNLLRSLKGVSSVMAAVPSVITKEFLKDHSIDVVCHMVPVHKGKSEQDIFGELFSVTMELGIYKQVRYESDIDLPTDISSAGWESVWETKGQKNDPLDVRKLCGYDGTDFEPKPYAERWRKAISYMDGETVLDVGCGAGYLGDYLPSHGYVGVERSPSLAGNFIRRSGRLVIVQDATNLPFADEAFDHVISHSMLEYMPSKEMAIQCLREMQRVSRKTVFVGDLRSYQAPPTPEKYVVKGFFSHTLFQRQDFQDIEDLDKYTVSKGWWGGPTRFNAMCRKQDILHLAIVGGGPAGCGLLTNYAVNGEYDKLLDQGVAVLEAATHLGVGSLGNYESLRSNSHGCAFFDAIDDLNIEVHDKNLNVQTEIPMKEMKELQKTIGSWHEARLIQHHISRSITNAKVLDITEQPNGVYRIQYITYNTDKSDRIFHELLTNNVCVCTGGIPYTPSWVLEQCEPGKVETAQDYFSKGVHRELKGNKVAVIGFSHSSFSIGHLFQKHHPSAKLTYITRPSSTRSEPRIYFPSVDEAKACGYSFEDADVCPDTQRVHRFGGVRGDARTFALLKDSYETSNTFNPDDYDHIIVACGYRMKTIPIFDRNGVELSPTSDDSGSCVGADGRLFPDHQIYAFGLGAGLRTNKETGGEPGCTRRADGIWLYQYAVGSIIRNSIKQRSMEWMRIYNRIGSNASVDTPLHHIGGYNMFTQQEWDDQVRDLLKHCGIIHLKPIHSHL